MLDFTVLFQELTGQELTCQKQKETLAEKNNKEGEKDLHGYDSILETDKSDNTNFDSLNTEPTVEEERIDGSKSN